MAEDRLDTRETNWRHLLPWTELFRGFRVAIGLSKLGLAAAGILVMAVLWYVLSWAFYSATRKPDWPSGYPDTSYTSIASEDARLTARWRDFQQHRENWNLLH